MGRASHPALRSLQAQLNLLEIRTRELETYARGRSETCPRCGSENTWQSIRLQDTRECLYFWDNYCSECHAWWTVGYKYIEDGEGPF